MSNVIVIALHTVLGSKKGAYVHVNDMKRHFSTTESASEFLKRIKAFAELELHKATQDDN